MFCKVPYIPFLLICILGCQHSPQDRKAADQAAVVVVIPGTWLWDADANAFPTTPSDNKADFHWGHQDEKERYLQPRNGAMAAIIASRPFERIDLAFAKAADLSGDRITDSDRNNTLGPGTVVVLKTSDGRFGVLQVIRYRPLHDLSFPAASILDEETREFIMDQPNLKHYHLEFRWRSLG